MIAFEEGEQIVKVIRRHYLVIVEKALFLIMMAVAPAVLFSVLSSGFIPLDVALSSALESAMQQWKVFAYSLWLLILWIAFFIEWTDYYLDLWIITNKRVIDVEQNGFFHREITSFNFEQIQDITVETKGFVETFLRFGTLHIQTAGHNREIIIRDAERPEDARALILKLQNQSRSI